MTKRRDWFGTIGEVFSAIRSDPVLLAPVILTVVVAAAIACGFMFLWR